jgi:hypothetical protein
MADGALRAAVRLRPGMSDEEKFEWNSTLD